MALVRLRNELQTRLSQKSAISSTTTNSNRPSRHKENPNLPPLGSATSGNTSVRFSVSRLFFASVATTSRSRHVGDLAAAVTLAHPDRKLELSKVSSQASTTIEVDNSNRTTTTITTITTPISTTRSSPGIDVIQKWLIPVEELKVGPAIGFGASATVFQGSYDGQNVALKTFKATTDDGSSLTGQSQKLAREALVLSRCRHQNLLHFYGICLHPHHGISIITRLMQGGSLSQYLQCRRPKLDTREVLSISRDIAQGMLFLHSQGIIHRDLKSANVLLDEKKRAVIADLGVSHSASEVEGGACVRSSEVGSYKWMAPELCEDDNGNNVVTFKSDVYSFGIVLWELVTCKVPYEDYSPIQAAACVVMHGLRPAIPSDCFPPLKYLMEKCWAQSPSDRPEFSDVVDMLCIISSSRVEANMYTMP